MVKKERLKKRRIFSFATLAITLLVIVAVSYILNTGKVIKGTEFTRMMIYKDGSSEGPFVLEDKKTIQKIIDKINSSPKEDLSKIVFERGPDGRILFAGKSGVQEIQVFLDTGNVITDNYYIHSEIEIEE